MRSETSTPGTRYCAYLMIGLALLFVLKAALTIANITSQSPIPYGGGWISSDATVDIITERNISSVSWLLVQAYALRWVADGLYKGKEWAWLAGMTYSSLLTIFLGLAFFGFPGVDTLILMPMASLAVISLVANYSQFVRPFPTLEQLSKSD